MNRNEIAELIDLLEIMIWQNEIQEQRHPSPEARLMIDRAKNTLIKARKKWINHYGDRTEV